MNLIDWQTNQIIKKLQLENTELIFRTFRLNQGFAAVVGVDENEIDRKKGYINSKDFESTVIRIYDSQLNLLHEINLKSVFSNATDLSHFVVDVSLDGKKIAWASQQTLSIYDIALGTLTKVYEDVNPEALIFYEIHFNEDGKSIVYFSGDGENSTSYGIVDLSTGDMKNFREDEYTNASKINVSGQFACITNSMDGAGRTSGKVLILDLLNKKGLSMKVDGAESVWARVSENGKFLIAASVNQYGQIRIRQYLVSTGEIIKEEVLMSGDEKFYITNIIEGEEPLKYYILGKGEDQFREGFVFDSLEK